MGTELIQIHHGQQHDTGAAAVLANAEMSRPMSVAERQAQINVVQELMRNNMKEKTHYGKVFGAAKPSLWKPGAEIIAMTLRVALDHVIEDLSTSDDVRYRVKAIATRQIDGLFLGSTYGECWSAEQKYMWRAAVVQAEWDGTPEDRRRMKYEKANNRDGFAIVHQVRTHPPDAANTILKMACKRADVAVVLLVTAASDIFSQDLEDLPAEILEQVAADGLDQSGVTDAEGPQTPAEPKRASEAKPPTKDRPAGLYVTGARVGKKVDEIRDDDGTVTKKGWTLFKITMSDGVERATFSETAYNNAKRAAEQGKPIAFEGEEGPKGFAIKSLEVLP